MRKSKTIFSVLLAVTLLVSILGLSLTGCNSSQSEANYPDRMVTMVIPYAAGGPSDLLARAFTESMDFPQQIEVVCKGGGAAVPALTEVANSDPDGYTIILAGPDTIMIQPLINPEVAFNGPDDFTPIITAGMIPITFSVREDSPYQTVADLVDAAKANPGTIRVGHVGTGSAPFLHLKSFCKVAGVDLVDVPLNGGAGTTTALLAGDIDVACYSLTAIRPHLEAGKARVLAVFTPVRVPGYDIPTIKELGYDGVLDENVLLVFVGPAGMPEDVTNTLYEAFKQAQTTDAFQEFANTNLFVVDDRGPAYWKTEFAAHFEFYKGFLKEVGMTK